MLSILDIEKNLLIESLNCSGNQLSSLDVSGIQSLSVLECSANELDSLDLSLNHVLIELYCRDNFLTELDLTNNPDLTKLYCVNNQLSSLDVSNNVALIELECGNNKLTSLELSANPTLRLLACRNNLLSSLDISDQEYLFLLDGTCGCGGYLDISEMPTLNEVCVWLTPFPPVDSTSWQVFSSGSPNVYYKECIPPELLVSETSYQPGSVEARSSEEGRIYMVPENTERDMSKILADSLKSVLAPANIAVNISLDGQDNGVYWLYATDMEGNISDPGAFTILGVGLDKIFSEELSIYPNPTYSLLNIESNEISGQYVEIHSQDGHLVFHSRMKGQSTQIDLSFLQGGVYFMTIKSKGHSYSKKVVKL